MKNVIGVVALALLPAVAAAADKPDWAFPVTEKVVPPPRFEGSRVRPPPPGSTLSITRAKADDMYDIPNWFPDRYPSMPKIVQFGNKDTQVRACGSCHLPNGAGHDESAYVAGLPAAYFIRQMADWKSGDRKFSATMVTMAKVITDAEIKDAADYFAAVKPSSWIRVVETDVVPKSYIGQGNKRLVAPTAAASRWATASSKCRKTRRSCSTAIPALASSPMCRKAASPGARNWRARAAARRLRAASAMARRCEAWGRCPPLRAVIPTTSFGSSGTCRAASAPERRRR